MPQPKQSHVPTEAGPAPPKAGAAPPETGGPGDSSRWLTVARISKTQGRHGEVAAHLLTDFPQKLAERTVVFLWDGRTDPQPFPVEKTWFHKQYLIFQFTGFNSIDAAQTLVGREIQIPRGEATALPDGSHYLHKLAGCRVVDSASGKELGRVRKVEGEPGNFRLAVETPEGKELLVPFAEEFCRRIAPEEKLIEVTLPDGLLDLNS